MILENHIKKLPPPFLPPFSPSQSHPFPFIPFKHDPSKPTHLNTRPYIHSAHLLTPLSATPSLTHSPQ